LPLFPNFREEEFPEVHIQDTGSPRPKRFGNAAIHPPAWVRSHAPCYTDGRKCAKLYIRRASKYLFLILQTVLASEPSPLSSGPIVLGRCGRASCLGTTSGMPRGVPRSATDTHHHMRVYMIQGTHPLLLVYTQLWAGPVQRMSIVTAITSPGGPAVYGLYVYAQRSRDGGPQFPRTQQDRCFADYYSEYGVPVEKEEYLEPTPSA